MVERLEYLGGIGNAPMVEVHHANEAFKPLDLDRPGEVGDGSDLGQEGSDAEVVDGVAEEIDCGRSKLTLLWLYDQAVVLETVDNDS